MTSVELCPKCHASVALTSYEFSFEKEFVRAYQNPTRYEASHIEKSLGNPSADMAALAQEIQRVESMLDALEAHHAHLDRHIQRSTQYIRASPIRRLPTEILGNVFASACTSFQRSEYKTALSISVVCSKWRDIALSTPSLWTHIYIAPLLGLDVYEHYLKRCGNIAISVKVEIPYRERPTLDDCHENFPYEETHDYHVELVSPTYRTCSQWKVAELWMNHKDVNLLRSHLGNPKFSVLESLTLVNDGPRDHLERDLFLDASFLTSFTIMDRQGKMGSFFCCIEALPYHPLREICTQSDVYSLGILNREFEDGDTRTVVLRPHLYDLDLPRITPIKLLISSLVLDSVIWMYSLSDLLQSVTIPTLQSLTMMPPDPYATHRHFDPTEWTDPFSILPEFLARSGCALQTFTVIMRGRYFDTYAGGTVIFATMEPTLPDSLVAALQCMKDLRALCVIEAEVGPSLFNERLFQEMALSHLLPELTSLEMSTSRRFDSYAHFAL